MSASNLRVTLERIDGMVCAVLGSSGGGTSRLIMPFEQHFVVAKALATNDLSIVSKTEMDAAFAAWGVTA